MLIPDSSLARSLTEVSSSRAELINMVATCHLNLSNEIKIQFLGVLITLQCPIATRCWGYYAGQPRHSISIPAGSPAGPCCLESCLRAVPLHMGPPQELWDLWFCLQHDRLFQYQPVAWPQDLPYCTSISHLFSETGSWASSGLYTSKLLCLEIPYWHFGNWVISITQIT